MKKKTTKKAKKTSKKKVKKDEDHDSDLAAELIFDYLNKVADGVAPDATGDDRQDIMSWAAYMGFCILGNGLLQRQGVQDFLGTVGEIIEKTDTEGDS